MNDPLVTLLYYTSNREKEPFASKIRENILLNKGDLPLISVSQKPLPGFGYNICVGEHNNSYFNEFKQILIGLREVKTPFVLNVEADFLYPPEYFKFVPPTLRGYRYKNVWISYQGGKRFYYKGQARTGAEINVTKDYLALIENYYKDKPEWGEDISPPLKGSVIVPLEDEYTWGELPAISFKTGNGIRKHTNINKNHPSKTELPFWGEKDKLDKVMFE